MRRMNTRISSLGLALLVFLAGGALAQDKAALAAKPAAAAVPASVAAPNVSGPAAASPAASVPADAKAAAAKKRMIKRKPGTDCTKLDDPWDNVCAIKKNAELACADLPTGKQAGKKAKKGSPPVSTENKRAQCVEGYMRNV